MPAATIYSAKVNAGDGFNAPAPLADIPGWTVFKQGQSEIYEITHNLNLPDPERDMHIVATPFGPHTIMVLQSVGSNAFTLSAWSTNSAPAQADFMFIATCKNRPSPPGHLEAG